jgi:hypothetical protein
MYYHLAQSHAQELVMIELNPEERYQLRKLQMDIDKRGLELQKTQQDLDRFVLELEHKYGLIGEEKTIDPRTATIKKPVPVPTPNGNGKGRTETLLSTLAQEAAD